ncbi:pentapeptide repeat-containing protein [Sorangium sp. So ce375]|uniref:pentapeptide repeat-containing protein n=1 Tax=Sorangium sp. So ce375 TaxID=3133306 RepID=UPI003F5C717F
MGRDPVLLLISHAVRFLRPLAIALILGNAVLLLILLSQPGSITYRWALAVTTILVAQLAALPTLFAGATLEGRASYPLEGAPRALQELLLDARRTAGGNSTVLIERCASGFQISWHGSSIVVGIPALELSVLTREEAMIALTHELLHLKSGDLARIRELERFVEHLDAVIAKVSRVFLSSLNPLLWALRLLRRLALRAHRRTDRGSDVRIDRWMDQLFQSCYRDVIAKSFYAEALLACLAKVDGGRPSSGSLVIRLQQAEDEYRGDAMNAVGHAFSEDDRLGTPPARIDIDWPRVLLQDKEVAEFLSMECAALLASITPTIAVEPVNSGGARDEASSYKNASLVGAVFRNRDLRGADFSHADLRRADLHGAQLQRARFDHALLVDAKLDYADLSGASLADADLRHASLRGAQLSGANAASANLERADLTGAQCDGLNVMQANLRGAVGGANLLGAVNTETAKVWTLRQEIDAIVDEMEPQQAGTIFMLVGMVVALPCFFFLGVRSIGIAMIVGGGLSFWFGKAYLRVPTMWDMRFRGLIGRLVGLAIAGMGAHVFVVLSQDTYSGPEDGHPDAAFVKRLARPGGIDLAGPTSTARLRAEPSVHGLEEEGGAWSTFYTVLPPGTEEFRMAERIARIGPGLAFYEDRVVFQGKRLVGRTIYLRSDYVVLDNVLFSSTPLSDAAFLVFVLNPTVSKRLGEDGVVVRFFRAGTVAYRRVTGE